MNMSSIDTSQVFILGRSIGGAVAINTLAHTSHQVAGAMIENTFTSLPDLVDVLFYPVAFLKMIVLRNYWRSDLLVGQIRVPLLFIKAVKDELIPATQMNQLYESIDSSVAKSLVRIPKNILFLLKLSLFLSIECPNFLV